MTDVTTSASRRLDAAPRPRQRRPGRRLQALLLSLVLVLASTMGSASAATALWSSKGSAAGQARTGTLAAPTGINADLDAADSVDLDWVAPVGLAPTGYYVIRKQGATSEAACGTGPTALLTTTSCSDNGLRLGTYTYTVFAVRGSWTSTSAASDPVDVVGEKSLVITRQPRSDLSSAGSGGQVVVRLTDPRGNFLRIKNVVVTVTLNPAGGGLENDNPRRTNKNGQVTFNGLSIGRSGSYTLTFTAPGYAPVTSDPFTYNPFGLIQAQSGAGQSTEVGTTFDRPVAFRVSDPDGRPVADAAVTFNPRAGTDGATGIVTGPTTVTTGSDGIAETTVQAGDREGKFTVEATIGQGGTLKAAATLTNTEPEPTSTPTTDTAPATPVPDLTSLPRPDPTSSSSSTSTSTGEYPTPTGTTPPATKVPAPSGSPTSPPSGPIITAPPTTAPESPNAQPTSSTPRSAPPPAAPALVSTAP